MVNHVYGNSLNIFMNLFIEFNFIFAVLSAYFSCIPLSRLIFGNMKRLEFCLTRLIFIKMILIYPDLGRANGVSKACMVQN